MSHLVQALTLWFLMAPWSMARCVNSRRMQDWAYVICLSGASDLWRASPNMCPVRVWSVTLYTHEEEQKLNQTQIFGWKYSKVTELLGWTDEDLGPVCWVNPWTGLCLWPPIGIPHSGHVDTTTGLPHYGTTQKHIYYLLDLYVMRNVCRTDIKKEAHTSPTKHGCPLAQSANDMKDIMDCS